MNNSEVEAETETFNTDQVQHAIKAFLDFGVESFGKCQQGYFSGAGFAARALRFHLSELEKGDGWIPISAGLPEKGGEYSVTLIDLTTRTRITATMFFANGWFRNHDSNRKVIAWMPLPEAYKGEMK